ncbi:MAG: NAD(+) diphosphatase [Rhodospirillaceae bacterium]
MPKPLMYTGGPLDRAAERRRDADWISQLKRHPEARLVPVWRNNNLVRPGTALAAAYLAGDAMARVLEAAAAEAFLGLWDGVPYFAADLSHMGEADLAGLIDYAFDDLRRVGRLLPAPDATILAYARGLMHWHGRQNFCIDCGAPTEARDAGHTYVCTNAACGKHHFPRTDPAVIMLVSHMGGDGVERCLLGRSHRWDIPMYSTLAGFVEPGENLEEAVAREVFEEAGIRVTDVTYRGSQPWPFPQSLMLGFWARATNADIKIDPEELKEARWFSRAELDAFGEFYDEDDPVRPRLPRTDSISRRLIEDWRLLND